MPNYIALGNGKHFEYKGSEDILLIKERLLKTLSNKSEDGPEESLEDIGVIEINRESITS